MDTGGVILEVGFRDKKLAELCNSTAELRRRYGAVRGPLIAQRLREIAAAANLKDLHLLPQLKCHPLNGGRKGQFAVRVGNPHRIVFSPNQDPIPRMLDGGLDLGAITSVVILEVVDYHGN